MQTPTKATAHSVYNLNYHIVFVTKYRNQVLTGAVEKHIKEQMPILCERYGWEQLALECMPDHVHLFVSAPPTQGQGVARPHRSATAPVTITQTLKSILALSVFKTFPASNSPTANGSVRSAALCMTETSMPPSTSSSKD